MSAKRQKSITVREPSCSRMTSLLCGKYEQLQTNSRKTSAILHSAFILKSKFDSEPRNLKIAWKHVYREIEKHKIKIKKEEQVLPPKAFQFSHSSYSYWMLHHLPLLILSWVSLFQFFQRTGRPCFFVKIRHFILWVLGFLLEIRLAVRFFSENSNVLRSLALVVMIGLISLFCLHRILQKSAQISHKRS
jgi:hypothetical protein